MLESQGWGHYGDAANVRNWLSQKLNLFGIRRYGISGPVGTTSGAAPHEMVACLPLPGKNCPPGARNLASSYV